MTIKVQGITSARQMRDLMAALSGGMAEMGRASEVKATYWVHCPSLDARGEQIVLDRVPRGTLIKVEQASYKHGGFDAFIPSAALLANVRSFVRKSA